MTLSRMLVVGVVLAGVVGCSNEPVPSPAPVLSAPVVAGSCGPGYPVYDDGEATDLGRPFVRVLRDECVRLDMPDLVSAGLAACMDLYGGGDLASARAAVLEGFPQLSDRDAAAVVGAAQGVMCADTR